MSERGGPRPTGLCQAIEARSIAREGDIEGRAKMKNCSPLTGEESLPQSMVGNKLKTDLVHLQKETECFSRLICTSTFRKKAHPIQATSNPSDQFIRSWEWLL